ncbi:MULTISPECIES: hypothetical protein [Aliarcobacter]|uniref:hypothetical protein n=1 Tax=Aliarcobacter TaxID=2321111 RepID=UPI0021B678F8|nr:MULTISPECIES: hypothetical protein [Aliarcobacter]MCT7485867.1 hypothetical protein [Aliarcobacter cryaerophilus]MCT7489975.1 hypothetical protein [Aliarcobacter cryaerophilus]
MNNVLLQRLKEIAVLSLDDFYNYGFSSNETQDSLANWLVMDYLSKLEGIEDFNLIQISLLVHKKLNSLEIIDKEFINSIFKSIDDKEVEL